MQVEFLALNALIIYVLSRILFLFLLCNLCLSSSLCTACACPTLQGFLLPFSLLCNLRWSRSSWQMSYSIHWCSGSYIGVQGSVTHLDTSLHSVCSISVFTTTSFCVYVRVGHSAPLQRLVFFCERTHLVFILFFTLCALLVLLLYSLTSS